MGKLLFIKKLILLVALQAHSLITRNFCSFLMHLSIQFDHLEMVVVFFLCIQAFYFQFLVCFFFHIVLSTLLIKNNTYFINPWLGIQWDLLRINLKTRIETRMADWKLTGPSSMVFWQSVMWWRRGERIITITIIVAFTVRSEMNYLKIGYFLSRNTY